MNKLILMSFFAAIPAHAETNYSDEVIAKAEAMLGTSPYETTDPNTLEIMKILEGVTQNVKQKENGESLECRFSVSIGLDGSVLTKTRMKQVEKECEEVYLNLRSIKQIELPEPKAYDVLDLVVTVSI
ncbi:hypothetical protein [Vibrio coralliirubri]|uniref:hypothetical protein n=1 Tax=Vibrio coralliirubri TaxID=1516159 RepID=UPI0006318509|nr:hypothetical protein [Vibrio coralliirubri]CDU12942.1 exported hypothetical protein [Vibrio coralliirubri]